MAELHLPLSEHAIMSHIRGPPGYVSRAHDIYSWLQDITSPPSTHHPLPTEASSDITVYDSI